MIRSSVLIAFSILITACGVSKDEHDAALARIGELETEIDELEHGTDRMLSHAQQAVDGEDFADALRILTELTERHPEASERAKPIREEAERQKSEAERLAEEARQEEERQRLLGFRAIEQTRRVEGAGVSIEVNSVSVRDRWRFDRYRNRWFERDAIRGSSYIVADISVSSESHNPRLLPIAVYEVRGETLRRLGLLKYEFYRWQDYGSYLGNYADYGNDFAHTSTIRFVTGLSLNEEILSAKVLFVMVANATCVQREEERFDNPSVSYSNKSCSLPQTLTIQEALESYRAILIINRHQLG